ncbi:MAG: ATP-binding protein [Anaerolineae bacterium]|nr:ATP-binding protein [Anaerolineae bacterium]
MDEPILPQNPYRPDAIAPFAGRQKAFEHLYERLTNPTGTKGCAILGRQGIGKTSLLLHFHDTFDETFVGVYLPLKRLTPRDESDLLRALAGGATGALVERNLSIARLGDLQPDSGNLRAWLAETYLPELFTVLRRRKLVFLLDDAGWLLRNMDEGRLSEDLFSYLNGLVKAQPGLGFVLALDARYEDTLPQLSPLVGLTDAFRLESLDEADTVWLLREPVRGEYFINDEGVAAAHRATGGRPHLLQRLGFQLYKFWENGDGDRTLTAEDVKTASATVYRESRGEFEAEWKARNRNERLTLTALISLILADPLTPTPAEALEAWLIESDYPLDMTTIRAALRGLEYDEIVENEGGGWRVRAGLMQNWLLDHARLETMARPGDTRLLRWAAVAILVLLVAALALIVSQGGGAGQLVVSTPVPTVTLAATPE